MTSHNALTNLKNRYVSVLKHCHILNTFGSLAKVATLSMGIMAGGVIFGGAIFANVMTSHAATVDYAEETKNSSNFIDIINAQEAYAQDYTGAGITVGVVDTSILTSHSELLGKSWSVATYYDGELYYPDWTYDTHGSHVAGIIAASLDGMGMYGVAYDASIMSMAIFGLAENDAYTYFSRDIDDFADAFADVRIINNSWGGNWYPYDSYSEDEEISTEAFMDILNNTAGMDVLCSLMNYALSSPETVVVFAAGNDAQASASEAAMLPRYAGSELNMWISVGSLDTSYITVDDGEFTFADGSISYFSNLAAGAERWTVFAPGSYIYSLDASTGGYVTMSGTSMATPVVSGALALVAQKFPWMTGSQLASTILSTANDDITIENDCFFQIATIYDEDAQDYYDSCVFNYYSKDGEDTTYSEKEIKAFLKKAIANNPALWATLGLTEDNVANFDIDSIIMRAYTSLESIIGQGVLDVGAAMGGIAELDANRMTKDYVQEIDELDAIHAIETLNTLGYNAVFSNDISGFAWDDIYHHDDYKTTGDFYEDALALSDVGELIGIEKAGEGTLVLTGNNTYKGATIVSGGILGLMQTTETRDDGQTSGTLTDSSVVVRSGGTFVGNGYVDGSLFNYGIVSPGDWLIPWYSSGDSSTLTVGNYTQYDTGALHIYFNNNAEHGTLSTTEASIDGALVLVPEADFYQDDKTCTLNNVVTGDTIAEATSGSFDSTEVATISPTLTFSMKKLDTADYSYEITTNRSSSAYSQYAIDANYVGIGTALGNIVKVENLSLDDQNLFTALDFSSVDGMEIQGALVTLSPATYNDLLQTSLSQQANLNTVVFSEILSNNYQALTLDEFSASLDTKIANGEEVGVAYLASNDNYLPQLPPVFQKPTWEFWASAVGSYSKQGSSSIAGSNWSSTNVGLMVGANKLVNDALRLGFHIIATKSDTNYGGAHSAGTDTSAFYVGMQGLYTFPKPKHSDSSFLDGVYISGLVRAGLEQNDMQRALYVNGYTGYYTSDWMDTSLSAMLAVGKDWRIDDYYMGPFIRLDASYMHRPDIIESGSSMRLHIEGDNYVSLPMSLGAHIGGNVETFRGQKVHLDLLLAWQHQLLDDSYESTAHFADFAGYNFTTSSETRGKDNFTMQATMKVNASESISFQFNAGTTIYNADDYDLNGGLSVMWAF